MDTKDEILSAPFVAINTIRCQEHYVEKFEELFKTRAHAIDRLPGFLGMQVLRCQGGENEYLVISHWTSESDFRGWVGSPEFLEGHRRGFEDVRVAKESGQAPPMESKFQTYELVCL